MNIIFIIVLDGHAHFKIKIFFVNLLTVKRDSTMILNSNNG